MNKLQIAIIVSKFNSKITNGLLKGAIKALKESKNIKYDLFEVPGVFEIPFMAQKIIDSKKIDGIIALGCVIKGETDHCKAVSLGVTYGIQKVSIENKIPIMFGILMCKNERQALARTHKGYECVEGLKRMMSGEL